MGDYLMNFNYPIPQYLLPGNNRALTASGAVAAAATPSIPVNVAGAGMGQSLRSAAVLSAPFAILSGADSKLSRPHN